MMSEEWEMLPYSSIQRLPLTATLPYFFRWKINNLKLMLYDLHQLKKLHNIGAASYLYETVKREAEIECQRITDFIITKRKEIERLGE